MGVELPNQNVYDVGATAVVLQPEMFGTDSSNPLGVESEEGIAHEMSEPIGSNGEDID